MKLIIGGAGQGKAEYAKQIVQGDKRQVLDGETCDLELKKAIDLFDHLHLYIRRFLWNGLENGVEKEKILLRLETVLGSLIERNPDIIMISNEIGYGIVPVDPFERWYREETGRVCCRLASKADQVVRVLCGMGVVIKDEYNNNSTWQDEGESRA